MSVLFFPRELFTYFGQSLEDTDHPEMTAFFFTPTVVVAVSFVFYTPEKGRGLEKVPVPFMAPNFRVTLTSYERRCIRRVEGAIQIEESNMKRYRFRLLVVLYFKNLHIFVFK